MRLSVVIPALNEEEGIGATIIATRKALKGRADYEIIVVDDGSTDRTAEIAEGRKAAVVRHRRNRGYGAAIKTGIRKSRFDTICVIDADCTYPPSEIPRLLKRFKDENDIVSGSRFTGRKNRMPPLRMAGNLFFTRLTSLLLSKNIKDVSSGMKIFSKKTLKKLEPLPDTFDMMLVITIRSVRKGLNFVEVPISYGERRGSSKLNAFGDGLRFFKTILKAGLLD